MIRPYLLLLPLLLSLAGMAQVPAQVLEFTSAGDLPMSAEKYLMPGIHTLDSNGRVSIDGHTVKVAVASHVDPSAVALALDRAGIGTFRTRIVSDEQPDPGASGYPVMIHSEDPVADDASFQEAKRLWIEANPELYREILNGSEVGVELDQDRPE